MRNRQDIDTKYTWNAELLYSSIDEWRKDFDKLKSMLHRVEEFKGKLGDSNTLLQYYDYAKQVDILSGKVILYPDLYYMIDMDNNVYNKILQEIEIAFDEFNLKSSYIAPELNSYDVSYLEGLLTDDRFKLHYMGIKELIKHKPHILSDAEEQILAQVGEFSGMFSEIFDAYDNVDVKFDDAIDSKGERHEVTNANIGALLKNRDRELRRTAYESINNGYKRCATTLANNYIGSVKKDSFYSKVYKYKDTLTKNLDANDLTEKLYYTLIDAVNSHIYLSRDWARLKKKIYNLPELFPYDMSVPISTLDKKYPYDEACRNVKNALAILGEDYVQLLDKAMTSRWIDVYPTKNKSTGGCCMNLYNCPPYILLNHEDTFDDMSALSHELGHALHHRYIEANQPYEYSEVSIFVAEIASTTNELLLKKYLYNHSSDKQEKLYILQELISLITGSVFSQTMFSEFEDYAHKVVESKMPLTKDMLLDKYSELQDKYGSDVVNKMDIGKYSCLRIPHFYRPYYVFKYATGIACAMNFVKQIYEGDGGVENYMKFLKSGSSDYPLNILRGCGIDLEDIHAYDAIFDELSWAINEVQKIIEGK